MKAIIVASTLAVFAAAGLAQQAATPPPATPPSSMRDRMNNTRSSLDRSPASTPIATSGSNATAGTNPTNSLQGLPWALEGHQFTLDEIRRYRKQLTGQIVWVKLAPKEQPDKKEPTDGYYKVIVEDPPGSGSRSYGPVYFPEEGATKMKLLGNNSRGGDSSRGAVSFYIRVEADKLTAVGRSRMIDSFKNSFMYTW
jgi:hypothetical protein